VSASVVYQPVKTRRAVKGSGSTAWEKTRRIFGAHPLLDESSVPMLRALAIGDEFLAAYWTDLADLVEKHGAIELDAEF
jgi:hypothetical protein